MAQTTLGFLLCPACGSATSWTVSGEACGGCGWTSTAYRRKVHIRRAYARIRARRAAAQAPADTASARSAE